MTEDLQWCFKSSISEFKLRSYNGWLTNVYIHYRSLIKQHFRCVEKKISIDKLPKDFINKLSKASDHKLVCGLLNQVQVTKSGY